MNLGEDDFVAELRELVGAVGPGELGIGDDAALVAVPSGHVAVVSTDDQVEGVHFRRRWCPPRNIGRRASLAAHSDLCAMGAVPLGTWLALHWPEDVDRAAMRELVEGVLSVPVTLFGGNITRSPFGLRVGVTVLGSAEPGRVLRRDAARPGDELWLTARLGGPAVALACLEQDRRLPEAASLIAAYLDPQRDLRAGRRIVDAATKAGRRMPAAMDITDGLLTDGRRLGRASGLSLDLDPCADPVDPRVLAPAAALGRDPLALALRSGEEYSLLVAADPTLREALSGLGLIRIGRAVEGPPGRILRGGEPLAGRGFDHLGGAESE